VTLFVRTRTTRNRRTTVAAATWLVAAILLATSPAPAATLADLAGPLRDLSALDAAGRLTPFAPAARVAGVQNGNVGVVVVFRTPADAAGSPLAPYGARVHRQRDRRVQAIVPVSALQSIALLPSVAQVRLPTRLVPDQGIPPTLTQGLQLTNALSMQMAGGITGLGVSVAIIDVGFQGYTAAELPAALNARSFRSDGLIDAITNHGTACAEIVADMAPGVDMSLLAVETEMDMEAALDWCLTNNVSIVSMSLSLLDGPFDGTHPTARVIDRVRQSGVLIVNSAGNYAEKHWTGDFLDADADRYGEFAVGDEGLGIQVLNDGDSVEAHLSWFQTASPTGTKADVTNRDYDLVLTDSTGAVVAQSAVTQNGDDPPDETLYAVVAAAGAYDLRVLAVSSNIAGGPVDRLKIFVKDQDVDPILQVPESSITAMAAAEDALTVAATRGVAQLNDPTIVDYPVDTLEPFSSRGPTVDGRIKPDMAGPDYVQTSPMTPFPGTSAAAPHVAGGAALLKSEDATRTATELEAVLLRLAAAQNLLSPITLPDSSVATVEQAGVGRLSLRKGLDTKPPAVTITFPLNGSTITTAQPTVVGVVTDSETGVDPSTIIMTVDGAQVAWDSFSPGSGVVTYTPPAALSRAAHTVTLTASDLAGNHGNTAVSNFRVSLPTLSAGLHMISLPYRNLLTTDPAAIFGVGLNELAVVRWVPTDLAFSKYRFYTQGQADPMASFEPPDALGADPVVPSPPAGLGYFVNLPREVILNVAGETLADVSDYTIRLSFGTTEPTGWNIIGNPYQDAVDWSTVQFVTNGVRQDLDDAIASGVTEGIIFEYTSGGYDFVQPQQAVLKPMTGYWLHVLTDTEVIIYPATIAGSAAEASASEPPDTPTTDKWQLQLIAEAPGMLDRSNYLGVAPSASSGHDTAGDVPEPPALAESVCLYFPHPDWGRARGNYAQDMKARGAGKQEWSIEVSCPARKQPVTISWPLLNASVPDGLSLRLYDLDNDRSVYMRTATSYTYDSGAGGVRHFKLVASQAAINALRIIGLSAAPIRGGGSAIAYQLSAPASVTAEVRNIAGRPVKRLVTEQDVAAGRQELIWNGANDSGAAVPAGTYLVHLTAKATDGQAVHRLCPVSLAR
jgi:subtilisin family serine protease